MGAIQALARKVGLTWRKLGRVEETDMLRMATGCLLFCVAMSCVQLDAQTLRKDYVLDAPISYQPSDPWVRGRVFRIHTGHAGLYYNCDQEECRRESPYICWKQENRSCDERGLPLWRRQLEEALWRLNAGRCCETPYPGCQCEPGVCTACNGHPGAVDIDYGRIRRTMAGGTPMSVPGVREEAPDSPVNSEYYRGAMRPDRGNELSQAPSPKSSLLGRLSLKKALQDRAGVVAAEVKEDAMEAEQARRVRLLRSAMLESNSIR